MSKFTLPIGKNFFRFTSFIVPNGGHRCIGLVEANGCRTAYTATLLDGQRFSYVDRWDAAQAAFDAWKGAQ